MEDAAVRVERHDAFLDARARAVVEPDHRSADGLGEIHDLVDLLGEDLAERAAEDGEVLREHEDLAPFDHAPTGHDAVGQRAAVLDPESVGAVAGEHVELDERARVEQLLQSLAGGELPPIVLAGDRGLAARVECLVAQLTQLLEPLFDRVRDGRDRFCGRALVAVQRLCLGLLLDVRFLERHW